MEINDLFNILISKNGSDLHLEEGQKPKARIQGTMVEIGDEPLTHEKMLALMSPLAAEEDWHRFATHGDLDFAYAFDDHARFRANYFRHFFGLGAVFRMIPSKIRSIEELGLPPRIKDFAQWRSGLVLVTGPTGSGKSTTLAAIIDYINAGFAQKIITIEEPVEFTHPNKKSIISHREVGKDTATFASGLRTAIKSDANIILVGEMRDRETIELALTASEMGILVFGTLHTNSAAKTIDRVIDAFAPNRKNQIRTILANNLKAIIAQQLLVSVDKTRRWAAYEILLRNQALGNIIQSGETNRLTSEIQMNRGMGMVLMDDSLMELVQAKKITKQEALLKAIEKIKFL
ncbi:MAG: PilT/PilU family type 4a pilus ATPase [Candidatus Omnitrophica bacterium]|nr:PilT/PilU family type 4a pilus ATPase [Candidatus Omnitrophota bacterium]MDE2010511.1 PilT/PilU family type 4a pilus ATPase [Candidatus Omnitrophota bacterium]MDE2214768.1 PilT/PilU family type 4a pilus ATPase [Candidatus Omnitrophota bacterium]MDE2231449.1 PilT/PilU family type 4a pilus ATPase [Candidatus Omnitrophota bacterium]